MANTYARTQVFWDVRNDSAALYHQFHGHLQNIYDLQVLELALRRSRSQNTRLLQGLGKSMDTFQLGTASWNRVRNAGFALFSPERGGSYEVFEARPLSHELVQYCAQEVMLLFHLEDAMRAMMGRLGINETIIRRESQKRVGISQGTTFNGKGHHMTLSTVNWNLTGTEKDIPTSAPRPRPRSGTWADRTFARLEE